MPVREVALWEGSVYAISQAGRAIGPFLGSLMGDGADWRWYDQASGKLNAVADGIQGPPLPSSLQRRHPPLHLAQDVLPRNTHR